MGRQFFVAKGKEKLGPYSRQQIIDGITSKIFLQDDLVWVEGMESWAKLKKVSLFKPHFEGDTGHQATLPIKSKQPGKPLSPLFQEKVGISQNEKVVFETINPNYMIQISRDGKVIGELSRADVIKNLNSGQMVSTDYVWQSGWKSWRLISEVEGLDSADDHNFLSTENISVPTFNKKNSKNKFFYAFPFFLLIALVAILKISGVGKKNITKPVEKVSLNQEKVDKQEKLDKQEEYIKISQDEELLMEVAAWFHRHDLFIGGMRDQLSKRNYVSVLTKIDPKIVKKNKMEVEKNTVDVYEFEIKTSADFYFQSNTVNKESISTLKGYFYPGIIDERNKNLYKEGTKFFVVANFFHGFEGIDKDTYKALIRTFNIKKPTPGMTGKSLEDYIGDNFLITISADNKVEKQGYEKYKKMRSGI